MTTNSSYADIISERLTNDPHCKPCVETLVKTFFVQLPITDMYPVFALLFFIISLAFDIVLKVGGEDHRTVRDNVAPSRIADQLCCTISGSMRSIPT